MSTQCSDRGFSLVELSLVIVIVGLLISGIVAGSNLMQAARMQAVINSMQELSIASNTFLMRYNNYPGDFSGSSAVFAGCAVINDHCNGNGDGFIDLNAYGFSNGTGDESIKAVKQLKLSGLYNVKSSNEVIDFNNTYGSYFDYMSSRYFPSGPIKNTSLTINRGWTSFYPNLWWGLKNPFPDEVHSVQMGLNRMKYFCCGVFDIGGALTSEETYLIDLKFDDGTVVGTEARGAATGNFRASQVTINPVDTTTVSCLSSTDTNVYTLAKEDYACYLFFKTL